MATHRLVETSNLAAKQNLSMRASHQQSVTKATHALRDGHSAQSSVLVNDNNFPTATKRQKARGALEDWYEQGWDFREISREGISPIILSELYAEIGVQVSDMKVTDDQMNKSGIVQSPQSDGADSAGLATTLPKRTGRELQVERDSGQFSPSHPSTEFGTTNGSLRHEVATNGVKLSLIHI